MMYRGYRIEVWADFLCPWLARAVVLKDGEVVRSAGHWMFDEDAVAEAQEWVDGEKALDHGERERGERHERRIGEV